jgi:dTDP-4-dehydrorhamnose reductase
VKLLLLGSNSQLGRALEALLTSRGINFQSVGSQEVDLPRKQDVIRLISRYKPDQVINAASYTNLVKAEADPEAARLCDIINTQGVSVLAEVCSKLELPLIHHSSSYVFDGLKLRPYEEDEATNPIGRYGQSKWYGERAIRDMLAQHIIVRTDWLISVWRDRFFRQHLEECKATGGKTTVYEHRFSPTPADDVARVFLAIAQQLDCQARVWGTYHYSALQPMSEEHFVETLFKEAAKLDPEIAALSGKIKISTQPVERPYIANTTLNSAKLMDTFGIKPRSRAAEVTRILNNIYGITVVPVAIKPEVPENSEVADAQSEPHENQEAANKDNRRSKPRRKATRVVKKKAGKPGASV